MSLTNPNKVVTEERLNEYHNTILPYLGGMPDILANKFSRADLYSTDEKMIGRWIDGKPVYQKVFPFPSIVTIPSNSWFNTNVPSGDIEQTLKCFCYKHDHAISFPVYAEIDANVLKLLQTRGSEMGQVNGFVLQYTKTTDSSVEIGIDTDYSTEEKIIGTWIDGKPLYQRSFTLNTSFSISPTEQNITIADLTSSNIDLIINICGAFKYSNGQIVLLPYAKTSINPLIDVYIYYTSGKLLTLYTHRNTETISNLTLVHATIQYTKTTD